ncbi:hypothetical protein C8Q73DRAFT_17155 [Cubamyces lactineus]|nr:hypothetical protein C8Q73DRAFT_17155 [Cubamyces lactineus]
MGIIDLISHSLVSVPFPFFSTVLKPHTLIHLLEVTHAPSISSRFPSTSSAVNGAISVLPQSLPHSLLDRMLPTECARFLRCIPATLLAVLLCNICPTSYLHPPISTHRVHTRPLVLTSPHHGAPAFSIEPLLTPRNANATLRAHIIPAIDLLSNLVFFFAQMLFPLFASRYPSSVVLIMHCQRSCGIWRATACSSCGCFLSYIPFAPLPPRLLCTRYLGFFAVTCPLR